MARRLTARGHEVVLYPSALLGALPCARRARPDVALFLDAGNSPLCRITRAYGIPTVIVIDGLAEQRRRLARVYLRFAERNAPRWADATLTDSHAVDEYERLLESVVAMAGPGSLPAELLDRAT